MKAEGDVLRTDISRPVSDDDRDGWRKYWAAHEMPWRTEPEIDATRQEYLAGRREVYPDIERGIYPFRDETGSIRLDRGDVEWLLETLESGSKSGPVNWDDPLQRQRRGIDARGANLSGTDLSGLPLARTVGGLGGIEHDRASDSAKQMAAATLDRTNLSYSRLEGSVFTHASAHDVSLREAHLEAADLYLLKLNGKHSANLSHVTFDSATKLDRVVLGTERRIGPEMRGIAWNGVDLTAIDWSQIKMLGDEYRAYERRTNEGKVKDRDSRTLEYIRAVHANRLLAVALRGQGLNEDADRFQYRAQVVHRKAQLRQRNTGRWIFSWLLCAIAGYGYKLQRVLFAYGLVIMGFALVYMVLGFPHEHLSSVAQSVADALQFSLTAVDGRIFFEPLSLGATLTWVTVAESVCGLVIEAVFTSMLVQRFFAH